MFKFGNNATWTTITLAFFIFVAACGDTDPAPQQSNNEPRPEETETKEPPKNSTLLHVDPCKSDENVCVVSLAISANSELNVKLVDSNNNPVQDAIVKYEIVPSAEPAGIQIESANSFTNAEGIATVPIRAGDNAIEDVGISDVIVSTSNPDIKKLRFTVSVNAKDAANYQINPIHNGTARFSKLDALLFESEKSCDDLRAHLANQGRLPTAISTRRGSVDGDRTIFPIIFPSQPNGSKYTVIVKGNSEVNENVEVVYGCADNNPAIQNGISVVVDVNLYDHIPNLKGIYSVYHSFDLRDTLPPTIVRIINVIGRMATDPGSFIAGCPAGREGCPAQGSEGLINILLDFLPAGNGFADTINAVVGNPTVQNILRNGINTLFQDWVNRPNTPSWASNSVKLTQDLFETLSNFRVQGTMYFDEPLLVATEDGVSFGLIPQGSARQVWSTFYFKWSRGCTVAGTSCGDIPITANQIGVSGAAIEGKFDGKVVNSDKLHVDVHTLNLNYGLLLMAALEKVMIPAIFGSEIDSLDAMLNSFIKCDKIENNIAQTLCTELLRETTSTLRDYVGVNLVYEGDERFLLSTPVDAPCTLNQPGIYVGNWDGYPLPFVQSLGKSEPEELRCQWEANIKFSDSNVKTMSGRFHGERR